MCVTQPRFVVIYAVVALGFLAALCALASPASNKSLTLTSSAFDNGGQIPTRYSCLGNNVSPALKWTGIPSNARSLSLIIEDPDAPMGTFVHWVLYNISPQIKGLPEAVDTSTMARGGEQGTNGRGESGYTGPCPPPGKVHHYHFHLLALNEELPLKPGATAAEVEAASRGHIVGEAELVGVFSR
jgi:Raf kinase inhibitor-like YbhB/YbcL family protein